MTIDPEAQGCCSGSLCDCVTLGQRPRRVSEPTRPASEMGRSEGLEGQAVNDALGRYRTDSPNLLLLLEKAPHVPTAPRVFLQPPAGSCSP